MKGGSDESTFMRLLERLPDAERYEADGYKVYEWLSRNKHVLGEYRRGELELGLRKERGDAGESTCVSVCAQAQTQ